MQDKNKTKVQLINELNQTRRQVAKLQHRLVAIQQLGQELTLLRDETAIVGRVLEIAAGLLHFDSAGYGLVNEITGKMEYHYFPNYDAAETVNLRLWLEETSRVRLTTSNRHQEHKRIPPAVYRGTANHPRPNRPRQVWLNATMKIGDRTIGVLNVACRKPAPFTPDDRQLLQTLADQTAVAIENARLYDETRQRVEELAALTMISQAITSTLDLQQTLTAVTDHAVRLLNAQAASVILRDHAAGTLGFEAVSGPASEYVREIHLEQGQGIAGWVIEHGETALVPDVSKDDRFFAGIDRASGFTTHSVLCVPLQSQTRTIGAIQVMNKKSGTFDQRDVRLLNWLTIPTINAIENARLFQAEHKAREQAETLREATSTLTLSLDPAQVAESILTHLEQVVPYDSAGVFLEQNGRLHVVAARGAPANHAGKNGELSPPDRQIYREICATGHPIILTDASADPHFAGYRDAGHIRGWMGVPLTARSEVIGYLALSSRQQAAYGMVEAALAQAFANQAAVAIQNARLFEQVRVSHERLQSLSRRLVEVQETERRHIARELHDEAGQALTSLMVGLHLLERDAGRPQAVVERVGKLKYLTDHILENLHRLAVDLRPASLDHVGLLAALHQYIETFGQQHGLVTQFEATGLEGKRLPPAVEINLYRIVQEALTNVARHARATRADVLLEHRDNCVRLIVEDDGVGFDFETALENGRLGLLGIRERAEMLGGTLVVESDIGTGTTIFVEAPDVNSHSHR